MLTNKIDHFTDDGGRQIEVLVYLHDNTAKNRKVFKNLSKLLNRTMTLYDPTTHLVSVKRKRKRRARTGVRELPVRILHT